jgi:hypothetical protein
MNSIVLPGGTIIEQSSLLLSKCLHKIHHSYLKIYIEPTDYHYILYWRLRCFSLDN